MVKKAFYILIAGLICASETYAQQSPRHTQGHSHNDYHQQSPLISAYRAGMASIEADVFLKDGLLYVAHDTTEIRKNATLQKLYLQPLARFYAENGNKPFADPHHCLQLVIDIKENHQQVLKQLLNDLLPFQQIYNPENPHAIRIVISGDRPSPEDFSKYPALLSFDGRPGIPYTAEQLKRIGMISDDVKKHSAWNGKGVPSEQEQMQLRKIVDQAHQMHKPFRFWATADDPATWSFLERIGVDWINTDHPEMLRDYYLKQTK